MLTSEEAIEVDQAVKRFLLTRRARAAIAAWSFQGESDELHQQLMADLLGNAGFCFRVGCNPDAIQQIVNGWAIGYLLNFLKREGRVRDRLRALPGNVEELKRTSTDSVRLDHAMTLLPPELRAIAERRRWGFTNSEIANQLGISERTVANRFSIAKKLLRLNWEFN